MNRERRLNRGFTRIAQISVASLVLGLGVGLAGGAQADTASINETTDYNTVHHWNTARVNTHRYNAMGFALKSWTPGTGGYIVFGARDSSGTQFAQTNEMTTYKTYSFLDDNGSSQLKSGTFYLNTHIVGGCGGDGCGDQTFKGTLTYNVNNPG